MGRASLGPLHAVRKRMMRLLYVLAISVLTVSAAFVGEGKAACRAMVSGEIHLRPTTYMPGFLIIQVLDLKDGRIKPLDMMAVETGDGKEKIPHDQTRRLDVSSVPAEPDVIIVLPRSNRTSLNPKSLPLKFRIEFSDLKKCPRGIALNVLGYHDEGQPKRQSFRFIRDTWNLLGGMHRYRITGRSIVVQNLFLVGPRF